MITYRGCNGSGIDPFYDGSGSSRCPNCKGSGLAGFEPPSDSKPNPAISFESSPTEVAASELSGRELDAAIATQVMGWVPSHSFDFKRETWVTPAWIMPRSDTPRYSSDFNACFEAQAKAIERFGDIAYANAVFVILGIDPSSEDYIDYDLLHGLTVTAEQRCRAMLLCAKEKDHE